MSRNLTLQFLAETERAINAAVSIASFSDVTRIAHVARVACGYRVTRPSAEYTEADRAWFRSPIGAL